MTFQDCESKIDVLGDERVDRQNLRSLCSVAHKAQGVPANTLLLLVDSGRNPAEDLTTILRHLSLPFLLGLDRQKRCFLRQQKLLA